MRILEKVTLLSDRQGLNQSELERQAGLPANRISKWNSGQGEPTFAHAVKIARVFGVSLDYLADDEDCELPPNLAGTEVLKSEKLNQDEAELLRFVRRIGLDEAWRRLALLPAPEEMAHPSQDGKPMHPS